jgi:hypothetical protein
MPKNNVNPDHYKVAGRERQGEDIVQEVHKQNYAQWRASIGAESQNQSPFADVAEGRRQPKRQEAEGAEAGDSADTSQES